MYISMELNIVSVRFGLDNVEEVHRPRTLGEWSNMSGYKMGSSLAGVYTTAKTSPVENLKHGRKNDMVGQHGNIFC